MKRHLLAAAILIAPIASPLPLLAQPLAPSSRGDPLSLDQAIQLALIHNRQLSTATLQMDKAGAALAIARTRRLPLVDLNFQAGQLLTPLEFRFPAGAFGTFNNIGPVPAADTSINTPRRPAGLFYATVAQPLSQLPRLNLGIRASELDQQAERERDAEPDADGDDSEHDVLLQPLANLAGVAGQPVPPDQRLFRRHARVPARS